MAKELEKALNDKAGTVGRGAQEAANIWAGTKNLDLLGALNFKARALGYTGPPLEIEGVLRQIAGGSATSDRNETSGRL